MRNDSTAISIMPLTGIPMITKGADLADIILDAVERANGFLADDDIIVVAQKIVSKAEGRLIDLASVTPSQQAIDIAMQVDKDPRLVELILADAEEVMRLRPGVLIVRHRLGIVLANAGIDQSNIDHRGRSLALLLPEDPDASARTIRETLAERSGAQVAVLIIDSLGRAWRNGTTGTAIGIAGMPGLVDLRGREDLHGRPLATSELGLADEVAAAASLAMGQADEGQPIVLVRGIGYGRREGQASELIRPRHMDLFA